MEDKELMDAEEVEENELDNIEKVLKNSPLNNPEVTFCEKTNYLEFLLSNAKTEEEKLQIKETINDYLDIYEDDESKEDEEDED